jgi:hypothetical protein
MAVPYTFGSATTSIPLSQLDSNFATTITLGNTAIQLGNTVTTLNNMTLANVTISSGTSNLATTAITNGTSNVTIASSGGNIAMATNGATAITVDTSQKVGIGTTSPNAKLDVSAGQILAGQTGNNAFALNSSGANYGFISNQSAGVWSLGYGSAIGTLATSVLNWDSSGKVGIGTSSPSYKLDVSLASSTSDIVARFNSPSYDELDFYVGSSKAYIGTAGATPLAFQTNNTERMRIDSNGSALINTTGQIASAKLCVLNASAANGIASKDSGSSNYTYVGLNSSGTNVFLVLANGNVQNANNSYGSTSDIKLKENIIDATPKLADLMQVKVRNYNFKNDPTHKQIGVIAQELEQVFPSMIEESPDKDEEGNSLGTTTKAVKYSVFVPMLIKAIQEQQALITAQTETINALTARIVALENK